MTGRSQELPHFPYHPDPVGTGSIVESADVCASCGERRGLVYTGPVYCIDEVEGLCPWCIADGRAAANFNASFTDVEPLPPGVASAVIEEILHRTPGFAGWQQEQWLFHCGDGGEFMGRVGFAELQDFPEALQMLVSDGNPPELIEALGADGDATGYLFRCRACGQHLAYADYL